jgi:cytochrome c oxidase subunit IV
MTSTPTTTTDGPDAAGNEHGALEHEHPSDAKYVVIAVILAAITAGEILLYVVEDDLSSSIVVPSLLIMMMVKFLIVTSYFMHLKYDNPMFRRVFYFGLILAVIVYLIALTSFEFWSEDFFRYLRGGP